MLRDTISFEEASTTLKTDVLSKSLPISHPPCLNQPADKFQMPDVKFEVWQIQAGLLKSVPKITKPLHFRYRPSSIEQPQPEEVQTYTVKNGKLVALTTDGNPDAGIPGMLAQLGFPLPQG